MTAFHASYGPATTAQAVPQIASSNTLRDLGVPLFMVATIAATVLTSKAAVALACIPVFIAGVCYGAFRNRTIALIWFIAYMTMEGMFKYLSNFSPAVYIVEPVLAILMIAQHQAKMKQTGQQWKMPPMFRMIVIFTLWGLAMTAHPLGQGIAQGVVALLMWYVAPLGMYILVYNKPLSSQQLIALLFALCGMCVVVSAFAVVQFDMGKDWTYAHLPGYKNLAENVWFVIDKVHHTKTASWRPASTGSQGGGGAFWGFLGLITAVGLMMLPALSLKNKIVLGLMLPIYLAGMVVSGVRLFIVMGILQTLVLVALNARSPKQMWRNVGIIAALAVGIGAGFTFAQSISGGIFAARYGETVSNPLAKFQQDRGSNMDYIFSFSAEHPLGIGFQRGMSGGRNRDDLQEAVLSNRETQFNAALDDLGLPGMLMQIALLIGSVLNSWRAFRRVKDPTLKTLSAILFVTLCSYMLFCFGGPALLSGYHFWLIAGIAITLPYMESQKRVVLVDAAPSVLRKKPAFMDRQAEPKSDISGI